MSIDGPFIHIASDNPRFVVLSKYVRLGEGLAVLVKLKECIQGERSKACFLRLQVVRRTRNL